MVSPIHHHLVLVLGLLAASVSAGGEGSPDGLGIFARALERCGSLSAMGVCLKTKAVAILDRALHDGPLVINDYLTLSPDPESKVGEGRALTEAEIESSLPGDLEQKETALDEMISDKVSKFITSRTIKFNVPSEESAEGRGKGDGYGGGYGGGGYGGGGGGYKDKKGGGGMMMMGMAMGGMMIQMAMAKIALIAGKALLIGKLALVLSAIIGLKKLVGGGGGESHQVIYADHVGGGGHGWGRSAEAHDLAYSAQARAQRK